MLAEKKIIDDTVEYYQKNANENFQLLNCQREQLKKARERKNRLGIAISIGLITLMLLSYTSLSAVITRYDVGIMELKQNISEMETTNKRLTLAVEELSSPDRIAEYAITQLGMIYPDDTNIAYKDLGVVTTAKSSEENNLMTAAFSGEAVGVDASIEVIDDEEMHPIINGFTNLIHKITAATKIDLGFND